MLTVRTNRCDGGEKVGLPRQGLVEPLANSLSSTLQSQTQVSSPTSSAAADLLETDDLPINQAPDTPPTPQSRLHSPQLRSATGTPDMPAIVRPANVATQDIAQLARRQRADRTSAILAQKMLQRWTLLGETCSNDDCSGTPLLRRPPVQQRSKQDNAEDGKVVQLVDPRRHCVSCQRDYVKEADLDAYDKFMQAATGLTPSTSATQAVVPAGSAKREDSGQNEGIVHSAAAKKRRFSKQPMSKGPVDSRASLNAQHVFHRDKATEKLALDGNHGDQSYTERAGATQAANLNTSTTSPARSGELNERNPVVHSALTSLEKAVLQLTNHLDSACSSSTLDPSIIAANAEALARTCASLCQVRRLEYSPK